jgi:hypothetical protein
MRGYRRQWRVVRQGELPSRTRWKAVPAVISLILSPECLDALQMFVFERCACAREDEEFLPGLVAIWEDEVVRIIQAERARFVEQLRRSCAS